MNYLYMKHRYFTSIIVIFLIICSGIGIYYITQNNKSEKYNNTEVHYGYSLQPKAITKVQKDTFTLAQTDSMITFDKLPPLDKWKETTIKDEDNNSYYIYSTIFVKNTSTQYSLKKLPQKSLIIVQKRKFLQ